MVRAALRGWIWLEKLLDVSRLLLVVFYNFGVTNFGFVWVIAEFFEGAALAEKIPISIEFDFYFGEAGGVLVGEFAAGVKAFFFLDEAVDVVQDGLIAEFVCHGGSPCAIRLGNEFTARGGVAPRRVRGRTGPRCMVPLRKKRSEGNPGGLVEAAGFVDGMENGGDDYGGEEEPDVGDAS